MITIVFPNLAAFTAFKAATPATDDSPFTRIGEPAPVAGSAQVLVSHHFNRDECEYLQSRGAEVRVGGIGGPIWPGAA